MHKSIRPRLLLAILAAALLVGGCSTTSGGSGGGSASPGSVDGVRYKDPGQVRKSQNAANAFGL